MAVWSFGGRRVGAGLVLLLLALAAAAPAASQEAAVSKESFAEVTLDGRPLFSVRGVEAFPAEERADRIRTQIVALARSPSYDPQDIGVRPDALGLAVVDGDRRLFLLVPSDAEHAELQLPVLGEVVILRIREAIEAYRQERTLTALARAAGLGLLGLLAFGLFTVAVLRLGRALERVIERHAGTVSEAVERRSLALLRSETMLAFVRSIVHGSRWLLILAAAYVALNYVLLQFPWTRHAADVDFSLFLDPLRSVAAGFVDFLPNLIYLVVIVLIARFAMRAMKVVFQAIEAGRLAVGGFEREWAMPTYRIARIGVIAFAVVMAYPYVPGSGSAAFQGMSIFLGVILSLGSSSIIANIIAGYSMHYRRTFRVGDVVRIGDNVGEVTDTRLLVTYLRTPKNEVVTVPNSVILGQDVTNYSDLARGPGLLVGTRVGIGYETPWRQVEAMLLLAAERTTGALKQPQPFVLECGLGDFAVTYELNVATDLRVPLPRLQAELQRNVLDVFNEYGVAIMTPAYVADPPEAKLVRPEDRFAAPARPPEP